MAVFRVEKNANYTTMSNYHLRDKGLSLKAKGSSNDSLSSSTVACVTVAEKIKNIFECLIGNASFSGAAAEKRAEVNGIEGFDVGDVQVYYIESRSQTDTGTTE